MDQFTFTSLNVYDVFEICKLLQFSQLVIMGRVSKLFREAANRQMFQVVKRTTAMKFQCIERKCVGHLMRVSAFLARKPCPNPSHSNPLFINLCPKAGTRQDYLRSVRVVFDKLELAYSGNDLPLKFVEFDTGPCCHRPNPSWKKISFGKPLLSSGLIRKSCLPLLEHLVVNERDIFAPNLISTPTCLIFEFNWWRHMGFNLQSQTEADGLLVRLKRSVATRDAAPYMYLSLPWSPGEFDKYVLDEFYKQIQSSVAHLSVGDPQLVFRHLANGSNLALKRLKLSPYYSLQCSEIVTIVGSLPSLVHISFSSANEVLYAVPNKVFQQLTAIEWNEEEPDHTDNEEGLVARDYAVNKDIFQSANIALLMALWNPAELKIMCLHFMLMPSSTGMLGNEILQRFTKLEILNISAEHFVQETTQWSPVAIRHSLTDRCLKVIMLSMCHFGEDQEEEGGSRCETQIHQLLGSIKPNFTHAAIISASTSVNTLQNWRPPRNTGWDGILPELYPRPSDGMYSLAIWSK
jgi:hypothetical protein